MSNFDHGNIVMISLGSNVGDRIKYIGTAIQEIACIEGVDIIKSSPLMDTEPVGVSNQETYLNQLLVIDTNRSPDFLLKKFKEIERKMGRVARGVWGPREIDIDIVFYEGKISTSHDLTIPHAQFLNRNFLLKGAMQLMPYYVLDGTEMSIAEIYNEIKDTLPVQGVERSF